MLRARRPTEQWLATFADRQRAQPFTYREVGATALGESPDGYRHDRWSTPLGAGNEVFERACAALREWGPQRGSGLALGATGPLAVDTAVAIASRTPVGFVVATCRVVYVEDEPDHLAWAYGSLPVHPEEGEERFAVSRSPDGDVEFSVEVFSKLRDPLARLAPLVARWFQRRATHGYLDAMVRAVAAP